MFRTCVSTRWRLQNDGCIPPRPPADNVDAVCMRHDLGWCRCFERRAAAARAKADADATGMGNTTSLDQEPEKYRGNRTGGSSSSRIRKSNSSSIDDGTSFQSNSSEERPINTSGALQTPPRKPHPIILSARFMTLPAPLYRRLFDEKFRGCILRADKALVEGMDSLKASNELPEWWDFTTKAKFHGFLASFRASVARDEQMRTAAKHARHLRRLRRAEARLKGRTSSPGLEGKAGDMGFADSPAEGSVESRASAVASRSGATSDVQMGMIETEISAEASEYPVKTAEDHLKDDDVSHAEIFAKLGAAIERAAKAAAASAAASKNMEKAENGVASSKCVTCDEGEALDLPWFEAGGQGNGERLRDMAKDALGPTWSIEAGYASEIDENNLGIVAEHAESDASNGLSFDQPSNEASTLNSDDIDFPLSRDSGSGAAAQQVLDFEDYVEGWWEAFEEAAVQGDDEDWAFWGEEIDEDDNDEEDFEEDDDIGVCGEGVSCARFGLPRTSKSNPEKPPTVHSSTEANVMDDSDEVQDDDHEHVNKDSGHNERYNGLDPLSGHNHWAPVARGETAVDSLGITRDAASSTSKTNGMADSTYNAGDLNAARAATSTAGQMQAATGTAAATSESPASPTTTTSSEARNTPGIDDGIESATEQEASAADVDTPTEHHPTKQIPWRHGFPHAAAHTQIPDTGPEMNTEAAAEQTAEDASGKNLIAVTPHTSTNSQSQSVEDSPAAGIQRDHDTSHMTANTVEESATDEESSASAGASARHGSRMSGTNEAVGVRRMRIGGSWFAQMRNETDADAAAASAIASVAAMALGVAVAEATADSDGALSSSITEQEAPNDLKEGTSEVIEDVPGPSSIPTWWGGSSKTGESAAHKDGSDVADITPSRGAGAMESSVHSSGDRSVSDASATPSLPGHGAGKMSQLRSLRPHTTITTAEAVSPGADPSETAFKHPTSTPAKVEAAAAGMDSASEGSSGTGLSWAAGVRRAPNIQKPPSSVTHAAETPEGEARSGNEAREKQDGR